jgi:putative flippase GtrA
VFAYSVTRFLLIGSIGFVTNYIVLFVVFDLLGLPILFSQLLGAEIALLATFTGNNFWAFRDHHHIPVRTKLLKYHLTSGSTICITSTIVILLVHFAHFYYGLALAISACVGMVINFTFNSKLIFKRRAQEQS